MWWISSLRMGLSSTRLVLGATIARGRSSSPTIRHTRVLCIASRTLISFSRGQEAWIGALNQPQRRQNLQIRDSTATRGLLQRYHQLLQAHRKNALHVGKPSIQLKRYLCSESNLQCSESNLQGFDLSFCDLHEAS